VQRRPYSVLTAAAAVGTAPSHATQLLLITAAAAAAVVPPGYYLPLGGGDITKCATGANGAYKGGWGSAAACTPCGPGIYSSAQTPVSVYNPNTDVTTQDFIATDSNACCESASLCVLCCVTDFGSMSNRGGGNTV
jgi:hypothetical protein